MATEALLEGDAYRPRICDLLLGSADNPLPTYSATRTGDVLSTPAFEPTADVMTWSGLNEIWAAESMLLRSFVPLTFGVPDSWVSVEFGLLGLVAFGGGRRCGLKRERLAFVGDRNDARIGVGGAPS